MDCSIPSPELLLGLLCVSHRAEHEGRQQGHVLSILLSEWMASCWYSVLIGGLFNKEQLQLHDIFSIPFLALVWSMFFVLWPSYVACWQAVLLPDLKLNNDSFPPGSWVSVGENSKLALFLFIIPHLRGVRGIFSLSPAVFSVCMSLCTNSEHSRHGNFNVWGYFFKILLKQTNI